MSCEKTIDKEFLIWLAGFFDGEGCFSINYYINKKGEKHPRRARLSISQAGERGLKICKEIQSVLGGAVRLVSKKKKNWKECYVWSVCSHDDIIRVAELILPYLRVKQDEVREKLELLKRCKENGRNRWTDEEIERLKKLGHLPATQLTKYFPRHTYGSIKAMKVKLGLRYDKAFSRSPIMRQKFKHNSRGHEDSVGDEPCQ